MDFIVEKDGKFEAFEFKWSDKKISAPAKFFELYPNSTWEVVNRENFEKFLSN